MSHSPTVTREYPDLSPVQADIARFKDIYKQYQMWTEHQRNQSDYHEQHIGSAQNIDRAGQDIQDSVKVHLEALKRHNLDRAVATSEISQSDRDGLARIITGWERGQELRALSRRHNHERER